MSIIYINDLASSSADRVIGIEVKLNYLYLRIGIKTCFGCAKFIPVLGHVCDLQA